MGNMTNAEITMKIGQVMQRIAGTGDAVLAGMVAELMTELQSGTAETSDRPAVPDSGIAPAGMRYVVCVEATLPNGAKVNHPLVGYGGIMPRDISDITMTSGTDRNALESDTSGVAGMLRSAYGVKVVYPLVTDEAYAVLEERLRTLLQSLKDAILKAAEAKAEASSLMNVSLDVNDISDDMLKDIVSKTLYAGSALNESGEVVERGDGEKYAEEIAIENKKNGDDDDSDDDDGDYDDDEDDSGEDEDGDYRDEEDD